MPQKQTAYSTEEKLEGRYVNYFKVGHNAEVFVVDYYQVFPEAGGVDEQREREVQPQFRAISSPPDAKLLMHNLQSAIAEYEKKFGEIKMEETQ